MTTPARRISQSRSFVSPLAIGMLEGWRANEPCRELPCDKPGRLQKRSLNRALRIAEEVVKGS